MEGNVNILKGKKIGNILLWFNCIVLLVIYFVEYIHVALITTGSFQTHDFIMKITCMFCITKTTITYNQQQKRSDKQDF